MTSDNATEADRLLNSASSPGPVWNHTLEVAKVRAILALADQVANLADAVRGGTD